MITEIRCKTDEEWVELRKTAIGGSDASAVVGLNPYKSAYALWAEKTGKVESFTGNLTTEIGNILEDTVAHLFMDATGKKVQRKNATLKNDKYPFAHANLDRVVVGENAILEIKTTNSIPNMKKFNKGEYPETYYCQVQHYLAVTEKEKAYLAVLINCREFKWFEIERDEEDIAALMDAEKDFWWHVEHDEAPAVDGSESTTETLKEIYKGGSTEDVNLYNLEDSINAYKQIDKDIKELEAIRDEHKNKIAEALGDNEAGHSAKWVVTYKPQTRTSYDTKALIKDHPEIDMSIYEKTSTSRVMRFKEVK